MTDLLSSIDEWGPEKVVVVSDRRSGMRGVLVIDNTARGMGKGGTRMSQSVSVAEVARLARVMTWKWAAADLFFGGAKAGIAFDPESTKREPALRAFARMLSNEIPSEYVFGLDVGMSEADAAIVQDELNDRGAAVGTPHALGGIPYDELGITGFGVAESVAAAARLRKLELNGARVSIQGFGAVGRATAARLVELGAVIVAVSTSSGVASAPEGFDFAQLEGLRRQHGEVFVRELGSTVLPLGSEIIVDCDILVPAAMQDLITADNAGAVRASLVVEGANLPATVEAQAILASRGITVVPDFIANAGGIIAAAFAMDMRYSPFRPETSQIFSTVAQKMADNTRTVLESSARTGLRPHEAARQMAQDRVRAAMMLKGRITG